MVDLGSIWGDIALICCPFDLLFQSCAGHYLFPFQSHFRELGIGNSELRSVNASVVSWHSHGSATLCSLFFLIALVTGRKMSLGFVFVVLQLCEAGGDRIVVCLASGAQARICLGTANHDLGRWRFLGVRGFRFCD